MIRIDDFPHGDKDMYSRNKDSYKNEVPQIIDILEDCSVDYIWGVSPLLCENKHLSILSKIKRGKVVMHGFDHGFSKIEDWSRCSECREYGGEFSFYNEEEIAEKYEQCHLILSELNNYDETHFIPPFNCFNQSLLNVLRDTGVNYIHSCDREWFEYKQYDLEPNGIEPIVSELYHSYDHVDNVIRRLHRIKSMITLHWIYDIDIPSWALSYRILARKIESGALLA